MERLFGSNFHGVFSPSRLDPKHISAWDDANCSSSLFVGVPSSSNILRVLSGILHGT